MKLSHARTFWINLVGLLACTAAWGQALTPDVPNEDLSSASLSSSKLHADEPVLVEKDEESGYISEWITVQWRSDDPIYLYVIRPAKIQKPPVVIYLYDYPAETDIFRHDDWCARVTSGGYAAVGFVPALNGQRYHDRSMKEWFVSEMQEALAKSSHDVQMVLNYLTERGDIDTKHVGVYGVGAGATIAVIAAFADSRIKAVDLVDPWGDWPVWMAKSSVIPEEERPQFLKPDFLKRISGFDPVVLLPNLAGPRIRITQFGKNPAVPDEARNKIAAALSPAIVRRQLADNALFGEMAESSRNALRWIKFQVKAGPLMEATRGKARGNATMNSATPVGNASSNGSANRQR